MEDYNKYIDHLIDDILYNIEDGKITVLTGRNGGGKSFIRKTVYQFIKKRLEDKGVELPDEIKKHPYALVDEISMDKRIDYDGGINRCCNCDMPGQPTSTNTMHHIEHLLYNGKNRFLVIDEIELGMGEELQAGLMSVYNPQFREALKDCYGILVITHSKTIVENLDHDAFFNLEGMTEEEWLNRKIVPMNPKELEKQSMELSAAIQKRYGF